MESAFLEILKMCLDVTSEPVGAVGLDGLWRLLQPQHSCESVTITVCITETVLSKQLLEMNIKPIPLRALAVCLWQHDWCFPPSGIHRASLISFSWTLVVLCLLVNTCHFQPPATPKDTGLTFNLEAVLAIPNSNDCVSEGRKAQSEEISSPEVVVLGRLKGFAEDAGGKSKIDLKLIKKAS